MTMTNWLFWAVAVFLAFHVIDGFRNGFVRKLASVVLVLLTLILTVWFTPRMTSAIREYTPLQQSLQKKCCEIIPEGQFDIAVKTEQVMMIEHLNLPEDIKQLLLENNNAEIYDLLQVADFEEYVGAYLANLIISAMVFLVTFLVVWAALKLLILALDLVAKLPLLRGINQLAGGLLGLAEGVVFIWIAFLLVTVLCDGEIGQQFFSLIDQNKMLTFLYENNVIMKMVSGLVY